jgi:hypothetical protein
MYSSSAGVLGCKVNTDRIAYWPMAVDCHNICVASPTPAVPSSSSASTSPAAPTTSHTTPGTIS